jgi:hypothetical protein
LKHKVEFFIEYFALDLIMSKDGQCLGVMAWNMLMVRFTVSVRIKRFWQRVDMVGRIFRVRRRIPVPGTGADGRTCRITASRHGICAISPDGDLWVRVFDHRRITG